MKKPPMIKVRASAEVLFGSNVVFPALLAQRRQFIQANVQIRAPELLGRRERPQRPDFLAAMDLIKKFKIPFVHRARHELDLMSLGRPHNGIVLEAKPLELNYLEQLGAKAAQRESHAERPPLFVYLDGVEDPQNLGAILRTCHFLGVDGVAVSEKGSSALTPTVSKASAGALELMENVFLVRSGLEFVRKSRAAGWNPMPPVAPMKPAAPFSKASLLVLGNEHKGIRSSLHPHVDRYLWIRSNPLSRVHSDKLTELMGPEAEEPVESLNVSVATGMLLGHLLGQHSPLVGQE
ncbi:hypothetical protein H9P43_003358 [Blastocladiella emersonii ATCC 22665]|nr:hypothetical protein H9P43_003358 [Blastocladiella emersonii ATCC 22665]